MNCPSLDVHDFSSEFESSRGAYTPAIRRRSHLCQSENVHRSNVFPTRRKYVISLSAHVFHTRCNRYCCFHRFRSSPRRLPSRSFTSTLLASLFYTPVLRQRPPVPVYPPRERILDHRTYVARPRSGTCLWCPVRHLRARWERGFSSAYLPFRCVLDHMRNICASQCVCLFPFLAIFNLAYYRALTQFIPSYPIPTRIPSFQDVYPSGPRVPPALL
jgi:hypothetical protein